MDIKLDAQKLLDKCVNKFRTMLMDYSKREAKWFGNKTITTDDVVDAYGELINECIPDRFKGIR